MKKKIVIIAVILILVVVYLSGCQTVSCPDPSESKSVAVGCIKQNPAKYMNKIVIIKGTFGTAQNRTWVTTPSIHFGNVPDRIDILFLNDVNTSILIPWKEYFFTGIVRVYYDPQAGNYSHLEVTKIQSI